jgi:two-component system, response regulator PdtaR
MTRDQAETRPLRVLIVEDDTSVGMGLRAQLEKMGYKIAGEAASSGEAIELFQSEHPDLVLLDKTLKGADGIELAMILQKDRRCPVIIMSSHVDKSLIEQAAAGGVFAYLVKPVDGKTLEAQLAMTAARFAELETAQALAAKLAQDLETRKLVERAKGILMKRANLPEDEAHRRLQQESQKRRVPLPELCKRIIESDEVLGGAT